MKTEQRVINRVIKFRAWLPNERGSLADGFSISMDGLYWYDDNGHEWPIEGNLILSQFTGLVDKEGNEIYEGDIVNIQYNHFGNKEVVWENKEGRWNIGRFNLSKCKKVGNIYQSPHLLPSTTTI